jgi:hypothetical protein
MLWDMTTLGFPVTVSRTKRIPSRRRAFHRLQPSQYPLPHPLLPHRLKVDGDGVEPPLPQKPDLSLQFTLPKPLEMGDGHQVRGFSLQLADRQPGALDVVEVFQAGAFDVEAEVEAGGQVKVEGACRYPLLHEGAPILMGKVFMGIDIWLVGWYNEFRT